MRKLFKLFTTTIVIFLFFSLGLNGQATKKENVKRNRQLTQLKLDEINSGNYSQLAREMSIEDFVKFYIRHGKISISKKHREEYFDKVYKDSLYTYFLLKATYYPISLIKVISSEVERINVIGIDGELIRQKFFDEIISQTDKDKLKAKCKGHDLRITDCFFDYTYNKTNETLEISCELNMDCTPKRNVKWDYKASYNFNNNKFID